MQHWLNLVPPGLSAELIAGKWGFSRTRGDEFAARSQSKATIAIEQGRFAKEITLCIGYGMGITTIIDHHED